jgi:unsaturated rhamnogalacturonyl hydrolase
MVVPLLVVAGDIDEASRQIEGHRRRLFDPSTGLYGWRWNEHEQRATHPEHWGTGSGWVVAAIARALHLMTDATLYTDSGSGAAAFAERSAAHARTVIDACLETADASGRFHNILDDHDSFVEGNVGQMLAYAMLTGVADGWLPQRYASRGQGLVREARARVDNLGLVQEACGSPHFDRQGTSAEAQAFFLLATNVAYRFADES